ncbi:MAG: 3-phosphoshikimate 1-carboxyvinyltransferase [Gracilibacteraceae bacterium]|jgi:3-phosphoshikimate 1-carboxyvinyltransferase|nr:3-phosphoshikimate 1-carboxyvinyltransferase [Gracilibacteraceae bacterium]
MKEVTILPGSLAGTVAAPPSKSIAHRALICAALAAGESRLAKVDGSDDILATAAGLRVLGAVIQPGPEAWTVRGPASPANPARSLADANGPAEVDCGESASTLRFLLPLFPACGRPAVFSGRGRLGQRPLAPYRDLMRAQGVSWRQEAAGGLRLHVAGRLQAGGFALPGDVSSQFISGLCFALPLLAGPSAIRLTTELESAPYLELTIAVLRDFGVSVQTAGPGEYAIPGGQSYKARDMRIEGDYSQAALFLVAGALGGRVAVAGLEPASRQGDRAILALLTRLGYKAAWRGGATTCVHGPVPAGPVEIDAAPCPDIIPALALAAALRPGLTTNITRAGRLRLKESDRLRATVTELRALGADIEERGDGVLIRGSARLPGGRPLDSHGDHRLAMMLTIAGAAAERPVTLTDPDCVCKSYPGFFADFAALGGRVNLNGG